MKYWKLRARKWWHMKVVRHFWPNLPFEIAYCNYDAADDNEGKYLVYPPGAKVLAHFIVNSRVYIIYTERL